MSDALFLAELADPLPEVGTVIALTGDEGRHAAVVRRIRTGESIVISDGQGRGVRARVTSAEKSGLAGEVTERLSAPLAPRRYVAVQALAKGDRSELALEMLTELGIDEIVPWSASRSVVRWSADRADKSLARWRATVREATKQSRRLRVPVVTPAASTRELGERMAQADLTLVLHEAASQQLGEVTLPAQGTIIIIIGPEGGISPDELDTFTDAGAHVVSISDGVLRTSTAGVVALAGLKLR